MVIKTPKKTRRPRKVKLKYMGRIKGNKTSTKKARLDRELRSYPCLPSECFLSEDSKDFPIDEMLEWIKKLNTKQDGKL